MTEKIAQARPLLAEQAGSERSTLVIVPQDNTPVDALPDGVRLLAWQRFEGLQALAEHAGERLVSPTPNKASAATRGKRRALARVGLVVATLAAIGIAGYSAWRAVVDDWENLRRQGDYVELDAALKRAWQPTSALYTALLKAQAPATQALSVDVTELRTADAGSCAGRRFRDVSLVEVLLTAHRRGFYRSEDRRGLCAIRYRVTNRGDSVVYAYLAVVPELAEAVGATRSPATTRAAALLPEGMLEVQVALPLRAVGASLVAIAAPNPSPQLRRAVGSINAREQPELAINRLQDLGVTLATATHAVL